MRACAAAVTRVAIAIVALTLVPGTSSAQSHDSISTSSPAGGVVERPDSGSASGGWLVAFSAGIPGYGSDAVPELMIIGVQFTRARPGRIGGDFSVGTMPAAVALGAASLGVRAGVALPLEVAPGLLLLPSGGLSTVAVAGPGGGDALMGGNVGLAAVALGESGVGVRVGATVHRFAEPYLRGAVWLLEMGMVTGPRR